MTRSLAQIEQDLVQLEQATQRAADELHRVYSDYLVTLGQVVSQQLVLVVYHICTQGYPEQFLACSVVQRQQFQAEVRRTAQQATVYFEKLLRKPSGTSSRSAEGDSPPDEAALPESGSEPLPAITPIGLLQLQERIEQSILEILRALSRKLNSLLREQAIVPDSFPEPLLEAAARSESPAPIGVPNLLSIVIETVELPDTPEDGSKLGAEAEKPTTPPKPVSSTLPIKVLAVNLRLSDLEFASSQLVTYRNQIRTLTGQVRQLESDYRRTQQEKAIAEAEAAWHATWSAY